MKEPSVLDYVISKLTPWRGSSLRVPPLDAEVTSQVAEIKATLPLKATAEPHTQPKETAQIPSLTIFMRWRWRSLGALLLALAGQIALEPPRRLAIHGLFLYTAAMVLLLAAIWKKEWEMAPIPDCQDRPGVTMLRVRPFALICGAVCSLIAFVAFVGNLFNALNLTFWTLGIVFTTRAFWCSAFPHNWQTVIERLRSFVTRTGWQISISRWTVVVILAMGLAVFTRLYRLSEVPPEMFSDHAEKLLDVYDVLHGQTHIFFTRNTGREAFQMYLTAAVIKLCGTGYSFLSLKIGTVLAGLFALPYIYLLGKELANRRVGLLALIFAGIAYWPNVISRVALRFALYPCFTAPALYYLVRGLRRCNRNDFILSGIFLGIGLHGYSPMRIVPFVMVVFVLLYLLHRESADERKDAILGLLLTGVFAFLVLLPLVHYGLENPQQVLYRTLTRLGTVEHGFEDPPWHIFLDNLGKALIMFAWDDGEIWVHSVPHRPALDVVSAALFYLGTLLVFVRYLRRRHWEDIVLLLAVPLLMLPSILSLAFPGENPSLNRTGAAIIPVFVIVGLALDGLLSGLGWPDQELAVSRATSPLAKVATQALFVVLLVASFLQNYDLVFNQYEYSFSLASWNTSEIGSVVRGFADSVGSADRVWVVPYPHWVDTRLVGINAGYPTRDYALWPEQIPDTVDLPGPKLYVVKPNDEKGLAVLRDLYPSGIVSTFSSRVAGKEFYLYFVP